MIFQYPTTLTGKEFSQLLELSHVAPLELSYGLVNGSFQVYRVGRLLAMVSQRGSALQLMGVVQQGRPGSGMRALAAGLRRLARSWGCDTVETSAYDERVLRLLERVGGKVAGWHLEMEV